VSRVLVTGGHGFIGTHLRRRLEREGHATAVHGAEDAPEALASAVAGVEVIVHLAGANRPDDPADFDRVNHRLTERLVEAVVAGGGSPTVLFASSTHAEPGTTPYGRSKAAAEIALQRLAEETDAAVLVDRLPGVFGPGARPHYNSVVATFCHLLARDEEVEIHDPAAPLHLVHVGDVVERWAARIGEPGPAGWRRLEPIPAHATTVGALADTLRVFAAMRTSAFVPDAANDFARQLHSTFVSYLDPRSLATRPTVHEDARGWLAEVVKSERAGQVFVSTSAPGVVRGNHWHEQKVERFVVLRGEAAIRLRRVGGEEVHEYRPPPDRPTVVTIPPGYTHNLENVGDDELLVLFWANEVFDPERPDTIPEEVGE